MMAEPQPEHLDTLTWLEQLYGNADAGWLTIFSVDRATGGRHTDWATVDNLEALTDAAMRREPHGCVWFGVATRTERLYGGLRGGSEECLAIPGLWIDVDIVGPGHKKTDNRLARDRAHAHQVVDAFPLAPTAVIDSGGGLQAWWLFAEMVELNDHALEMLAAWGTTWTRLGEELDVDMDNVFDPARIMRLAGTTNRKEDLARPVTLSYADWGRRYGLDDLDGYLDAVPEPPEFHKGSDVPYIGPERPGDAYSARHSGGEVLAAAGWTFVRRQRNGDEKWCRPGKDVRDGDSATVYANDGHTTIYSSTVTNSIPGMDVMTPYKPHQLYAFLMHGGDFSKAASELRRLGYGATHETVAIEALAADGTRSDTTDELPDWAPRDLADVLAGNGDAPQPTILSAPEGMPLFYAGRVNSVFGESGVGKTWVELAAMATIIAEGGTAMLIDLEDTPHGITSRLRLLGVTDAQIAEQFLYVSPQTGWGPVAQATIAAVLASRTVDLVCIDSTGEAMAAAGVKGNDDDDVARWFVAFPKYIARRGPAVIIVDHVPKDPNAPSGYAIGSQRKIAAVDGAAYRIESVKVPSRTDDGLLKVIVAKDRHGNHTKGKVAAMIAVTHTLFDGVEITLSGPEAAPVDDKGNFRPTIIMERVSILLESHPGLSRRQIESQVSGKSANIRRAVDVLFQEGYIDFAPGTSKGAAFEVVRPFREADDEPATGAEIARDVNSASPASPPRPSAGDALPDRARPRVPLPTGHGTRSGPVKDTPNEVTASPRVPLDGTRLPIEADPDSIFAIDEETP